MRKLEPSELARKAGSLTTEQCANLSTSVGRRRLFGSAEEAKPVIRPFLVRVEATYTNYEASKRVMPSQMLV